MLNGVIPILLSPFESDGSLDRESLNDLIEYYLKGDVDGLVCFGEVSEPSSLSDDEKDYILKTTLELSKDVPIITGISRENVELSVNAARMFLDRGVSALLLAPPRHPEMEEQKIFEYYCAIDEKVDAPIVILDQPAGIRPKMSPELIARIVKNTSNVRYLKIEEQPTPIKMERINELNEESLIMLGATHGRTFLWELERGAKGIMTSTPLPKILVSIWKNYNAGNIVAAREIFYKSLPLAYYFAEATVAVKKEVLKYKGAMKTSKMRDDSLKLTKGSVNDLIQLVDWTERSLEGLV